MSKKREISVVVNYPKEEEKLKELNDRKAEIVIKILKEKYGNVILEEFINSMREKREDYLE